MFRRLHRRPFASLAALLVGAAGLGGLSVSTAAPASASTGCSVAYAVQSDWGAGFVTSCWNCAANHWPAGTSKPGMAPVG